ncbi:MHYT domain-containing protein [Nocardia yamanashiensis]|uniref:MHYT domain-containing protein n=1 Tax=Nocardia yamanashiensis TaxID=209247 RepID=UPI00082D5447
MLEIHHFSYGWVTPVVAYIMSVTGSLLGLRCTARARSGDGRKGWLIAAAVAIGGTGIWVMHFIAMLGFSIHGAAIRYNVPITLLSAAIAMVVVWVGLSIVTRGHWGVWSLPVGGTITGLGVGAMHYSGMYAMKSDAMISYDFWLVTLSMVIAVVASTVALWFTLHINGIFATIGAALIMGVAVCGMHYTGMASMSAHHSSHSGTVPAGAGAMELLAPLMISVSMVTMVLLIHVGLTEVDEASMVAEPTRPEPAQREAWAFQADQAAAQANRMGQPGAVVPGGYGGPAQNNLGAAENRPGYGQPHQGFAGPETGPGSYRSAADFRPRRSDRSAS